MPVGAPEPAVDPYLGELEGIGVGPPPALERGAPAAEDRNPFFFFSLDDDDRGSGEPFFCANFLGYELNPVASVMSRAHRYVGIGDRVPRPERGQTTFSILLKNPTNGSTGSP